MHSKKVVIGSGGFIGRAVLSRIDAIGIETSAAGRALDKEAVLPELEGADEVFLCAGRTGGVGRMKNDPFSFIYPNVRIAMNVFEACKKAGVRRLVCLQSTTGYPDTSDEVSEDMYLQGDVHPAYFAPGNANRFIYRLSMMFDMEVVFFRPSNVYGPGNNFDPQTSHVIEATVRKVVERQDPMVIWGSGSEVRDAVYIDDLADAMVAGFAPGAYNIGTGTEMSVNEMVEVLCDHAGFRPKIEHDLSKPTAIPARRVSILKALGQGWKPKISMEEGLKRAYDWYLTSS